MEDFEIADDFFDHLDFSRQRSFTWSHPERGAVVIREWVEEYERGLVREQSHESIFEERKVPVEMPQQPTIQNGTSKKRQKSYAQILATAILSSPEKRLTLAQIYDWIASNVDEYKNQGHLPSTSGWKNAVRHNLSVQSCFKRVKRNGVEKPSWWTVDMRQAGKRRLSFQPILPQTKDEHGQQQSQQHEVEQKRMPRKSPSPLESISEEETSGFSKGIDSMNSDVKDGRRQLEFTVGDGQIIHNLIPEQTIKSSSVIQQQEQPIETSAVQLVHAWINRLKIPGSSVIISNDGSGLQTLLRVNVVLRSDKSTQTDDPPPIVSTKIDIEGSKMQSQTEVVDSSFSFEPVSFSRACRVDDHTIFNFGPKSVFDASNMMGR